jgi:hypothetical protein
VSRIFYPQARAVLQIVFDGFSLHAKDTAPQIIPIIPMEATVHRNSYRQADSWELTFDANDLPIDPQLVRSGAVEIFLFQTTARDQDLRIMSRQHTVLTDTTEVDGKPRDAFDAQMLELGLRKAKEKFTFGKPPMIAGLIDDVSLEMGTGGKTVHLSGQDYTAYLISRQWPPTKKGRARRIPTGMRLDKFVEQMLLEADPQQRLKVKVENIDEASLPNVGAGETRGKRRGIPVEQDTSYWDVIYKTVTRYGAICFVRGLDVVITRPSALREEFDHRIRRLAWGNNVESLELTRHLGKEKVPRVIVRGYDEKTQKTVTVEFPREPASQKSQAKTKKLRGVKRKSAIPEGTIGVEEDEYQIIPVYGISDPIRLYEIAQNIFTLLGQAERRIRVTTNDLNDFEGNSMLDMNPGDPITIGFKDFNKELLANDEVSHEAKINHLLNRGYNEAVAAVIASHYRKFDFLKRPLRIREMSYEYSVGGGISTEIEAVDFVVIDGQRDPNLKKRRTLKHIERVAEVKR